MREFRGDADRGRKVDEDEAFAKRRAPEAGGKLSELDASAYAGQRVSDLGERQREQVATEALSGETRTLPHRAEMEERFGRSFADVEVAGGAGSKEALAGVGASGVTRDRTIAFREQDPSREVVAHELTHVVQAEGGTGSRHAAESEAHGAEHALKTGAQIQISGGLGSSGVAHFRDDNDVDHSQYEHKSPYKDPFRAPDDEKRVNWGDYVKGQAPGDPMVQFDLEPGPACPFPPNAILEKMPTHHNQDNDYPNPFKDQDKDKVQVGHWKLEQRQEAWDAYRGKAAQVSAMQADVAPDINLFRHAEKNEDLKALGFIMKKGFQGDAATLANQQEVPKQGGPAVGSLFNGQGGLNTTKADDKSIAGAATAREHGKGHVEGAFLGSQKADTDLSASLNEVKNAAEGLISTKAALEAAVAAIEYANAEKEADEAKEEIEQLKKSIEFVKSFIEFAVSGPAKLAKLAEEGIDKLEAVGTVASLILDIFPVAGMKEAEAKLAAAQSTMKSSKAKGLQANFEKAKADARGAVHHLAAQKDLVRSALTARREAYNAAGTAAGEVATGSESSKQKVAGFISAIPIVENVVAALRNIVEKTRNARPAYDEKAGLGYGIALYHQSEASWELPGAIGILEWSNMWFAFTLDEWQTRLGALMATKEQIGGAHPGG